MYTARATSSAGWRSSRALHDGAAAQVTAVAPYLVFWRKDRRTKLHDPVTTRYVERILEAAGVDTIASLDVHSPAAFDNAFDCVKEHLSPPGRCSPNTSRRSYAAPTSSWCSRPTRAASGACAALRAQLAAATHGVLTRDAAAVLADARLESLVVTDSVGDVRARCEGLQVPLHVLGSSGVVADAIRRSHPAR